MQERGRDAAAFLRIAYPYPIEFGMFTGSLVKGCVYGSVFPLSLSAMAADTFFSDSKWTHCLREHVGIESAGLHSYWVPFYQCYAPDEVAWLYRKGYIPFSRNKGLQKST